MAWLVAEPIFLGSSLEGISFQHKACNFGLGIHHLNVWLLMVQKSQTTTKDVWNFVRNGISMDIIGYLPYQLAQDFFHQQYYWCWFPGSGLVRMVKPWGTLGIFFTAACLWHLFYFSAHKRSGLEIFAFFIAMSVQQSVHRQHIGYYANVRYIIATICRHDVYVWFASSCQGVCQHTPKWNEFLHRLLVQVLGMFQYSW